MKCEKDIYLIGYQRAGTHAIGNYILRNGSKEKAREVSHDIYQCGQDFLLNAKYTDRLYERYDLTKIRNCRNLITSYELHNLYNISINIKQCLQDIQYNEYYCVILLRDIKNHIASLMKMYGNSLGSHIINDILSRYKEALNETNYLENRVVVLFDLWFLSKDYRKDMCKKLGLDFYDYGLNEVTSFGNGSSFDSQNYNGNAQSMKVRERYKLVDQYHLSKNVEKLIERDSLAFQKFGSSYSYV